MEREEEEEDKFLGEWHFPVTVEMMRKWNQEEGVLSKSNWIECLRDTNDLKLLKQGIYCLFQSKPMPYGSHQLWLDGNTEPLRDQEKVMAKLIELLPDQPTSSFISDYVPNIVTCMDTYRWQISPELRVEFSSWMCYGKQGLYVSAISTLPEYRELVKKGENKFTVCLHHSKPQNFQLLWPNLVIEPVFFQGNEQNQFIEFHRMYTYDEAEFDPDFLPDSEEENLID